MPFGCFAHTLGCRGSGYVDPNLGVGDFCEQPIEDEKLEDPQDAKGSDVGSDYQDGPSKVLEMVRIGKVVRQRCRVQGEADARYRHDPEREESPSRCGTGLDFPHTHRRLR